MKYPFDQIVILSHKRSDTIQKKTLMLLARLDIPIDLITIYVSGVAEVLDYDTALRGEYRIRNSPKGVSASHNFMDRDWPEGTRLIGMDDDMMDLIVHNYGATRATKRSDQGHSITREEFLELCRRGFKLCARVNAYIWGVYPMNNPGFMHDRVFFGLTYISGACYGMVVRHDQDLAIKYLMKDDHERSLRHFKKDGVTVRFENVGISTTYMGGHGGMQVDSWEVRHKKALVSIKQLCAEFPEWTKQYDHGGYPDVRLKRVHSHEDLHIRSLCM